MKKKIPLGIALLLILIIPTTSLTAHAETAPEGPSSDSYTIQGAGATFPYPLIDKWRVDYNREYPQVNLNYQSVGSGAGINLYTKKTVDFGASDAPLQPSEVKGVPNTLHIPETMGAIVIVYNLPEFHQTGLKLTGKIIADIFMGKITTWNDPAIKTLNPKVTLSKNRIVIAHRSDGSGTTFAFTDYLSKASSAWKGNIGQGKSVPWTTGIGGNGNAGVASIVKNVPWSLGYVELAYAFQNKMTYAFVQNADSSAFVEPSLATTAAAASVAAATLPQADGDWSQVSIVNQSGKNSYPISTFTYILVFKNLEQVNGITREKATAEVNFLYWIINDGQQFSTPLLYVPIPDAVKKIGEQGLGQIQFNGNTVPEFGPLAGLVFLVAIISIIAVSAKTRLRPMQRS